MARHAKSQLLYLQMIMLKVDSEYARYILSVHTPRFNYTQPLNNSLYTHCEYSFEMNPFCHASTKGALAIRRIFSLVDMITKPKFSNCPNVFKIELFR